ncbi:MAG: hydrogenase expression/formation C-terminal domain-containing protein [Steroidobacteraceae bacterium]
MGSAPPSGTAVVSGVLREVAERLEALAEHGECGVIDLKSLPLSDQHLQQLRERLGRGEVTAQLEILGPSEIWETRYPGVWWVRHLGVTDLVAAERIEITRVPDILSAALPDVVTAAQTLNDDLALYAAEREERTDHGRT